MSADIIEHIKNRRSIRSYKNQSVSKEQINEIIQAGRFAPSATNRQPWRFIVITNKSMIEDIANTVKDEMKKIVKRRFILKFFYPSLKNDKTIQFLSGVIISKKDLLFFNAPVLIFIVTKKRKFNDESCACCAQNMMLAADALGLGSCWIGFAHFLGLNTESMKKIGVPKGYHIAAALIFGHPDKGPSRILPRKPTANVINWIE
jgi:nitroreductase